MTLASIVCNRIQQFEEILKYEDVWSYFGWFFCWVLGLFVCLFSRVAVRNCFGSICCHFTVRLSQASQDRKFTNLSLISETLQSEEILCILQDCY